MSCAQRGHRRRTRAGPCFTSAFTGLVLTLQGYNTLSRFGAVHMVGALIPLSLVRELAPVLAALMITARARSAIAATLGNMRVSQSRTT